MSEWSPQEIEMYSLETYGPRLWASSMCGCKVAFDGQTERLKIRPCDFAHVPWCWRTGQTAVEQRIELWRNCKLPSSYREILADYLAWGKQCPLAFGFEIGGFAHGKASREFAIKQYVEDYARKLETGECLFWGEELLVGTPMSLETFQAIYHREPEPILVHHFVLKGAADERQISTNGQARKE